MSNPRPLTATHLQELAGKTAFLRGRAYANAGVVHITQQDAQAVSAKVMGSANYTVGLQFKNAWLSGSCTCPVGRRGEFCKHQVALGLCWIGPREASTPSAETGKRGKAATKATAKQHHSPEAAVQGWLQAQSAEALRTLVLSMAAAPQVKNDITIEAGAKDDADRKMAALFTRLVTKDCAEFARPLFQSGTRSAFELAFAPLGRVAARDAFSDPSTAQAMMSYAKYIDLAELMKLMQ